MDVRFISLTRPTALNGGLIRRGSLLGEPISKMPMETSCKRISNRPSSLSTRYVPEVPSSTLPDIVVSMRGTIPVNSATRSTRTIRCHRLSVVSNTIPKEDYEDNCIRLYVDKDILNITVGNPTSHGNIKMAQRVVTHVAPKYTVTYEDEFTDLSSVNDWDWQSGDPNGEGRLTTYVEINGKWCHSETNPRQRFFSGDSSPVIHQRYIPHGAPTMLLTRLSIMNHRPQNDT